VHESTFGVVSIGRPMGELAPRGRLEVAQVGFSHRRIKRGGSDSISRKKGKVSPSIAKKLGERDRPLAAEERCWGTSSTARRRWRLWSGRRGGGDQGDCLISQDGVHDGAGRSRQKDPPPRKGQSDNSAYNDRALAPRGEGKGRGFGTAERQDEQRQARFTGERSPE